MNILVVNDDGITEVGILHLAAALRAGFPDATLYVCAPDRQRTAAGHGITVHESLYLQDWEFPGAFQAWSCTGTPADCVKVAFRMLKRQGIKLDLVCSGINMGSNLGDDVFYSGTVSAAMEGSMCGIPSVAFSACSHTATHFEVFPTLVPSVCRCALEHASTEWILNVNVPDLPPERIQGMRFTRLGVREYTDDFEMVAQGEGRYCYTYTGKEVFRLNLPPETDVGAFRENCITITPVHRDMTMYELVGEMENWGIQWR